MSGEKCIVFRGKVWNEAHYEIVAPMAGPLLGMTQVMFRFEKGHAAGEALMTLEQLDAFCSQLRHVHTSIEFIKKHGLLPPATPDSDKPQTEVIEP